MSNEINSVKNVSEKIIELCCTFEFRNTEIGKQTLEIWPLGLGSSSINAELYIYNTLKIENKIIDIFFPPHLSNS